MRTEGYEIATDMTPKLELAGVMSRESLSKSIPSLPRWWVVLINQKPSIRGKSAFLCYWDLSLLGGIRLGLDTPSSEKSTHKNKTG